VAGRRCFAVNQTIDNKRWEASNYPLNIIVRENIRVASAPAVRASGNAAMIICAKVLANMNISMQKSKMRPWRSDD
jgi:hypothetical protein